MSRYNFFAGCPFYFEELLKEEIELLGGANFKIAHGGVEFEGTIETAYKVCLWSRVANRLLLHLLSFEACKPEDIRAAAEAFEWERHFSLGSTIAVDAGLSKTKICTADFAALSVKDGLVDRARRLTGRRPNVDTVNPDIRLNIHISLKNANISLDLSGEGLHKRGYRVSTVPAGLRENTAAAVLLRAGWPELIKGFYEKDGIPPVFLDPMCGSGTLLIEAIMMAADIAPSIDRKHFGFENWLNHDQKAWTKLKAEAQKRRAAGIETLMKAGQSAGTALFFGRDISPAAINAARTNLSTSAAADLLDKNIIDISGGDFFKEEAPANGGADIHRQKLLSVNPPYGKRLNKDDDMIGFYRHFGEVLKRRYRGWSISLLTGQRELSDALELKADKLNTVYNGGLRCTLAHFRMFNDNSEAQKPEESKTQAGTARFEDLSPGSQMMYNRLKRNSKRLKGWLKQTKVQCYRLYDADMPEYSVAVDIYPPEAVVQEYMPPKSIDKIAASRRLKEATLAVQTWLEIPEESVKLKVRKRQRGLSQYEKKQNSRQMDKIENRRIIKEHGLKFFIDTTSYIDTGIFLDSRPIRALIRDEAEGKSFLNLFCYTGTASVYAAAGGAVSTTSVDTSRTYLDWAGANLRLNNFRGSEHSLIKADCMSWLKTAIGRWDLIYLDPPTFSNSKDRNDIFDLQKDHEELIRLAASRLTKDGVLLFCNNFRKFRMNEELKNEFRINEISEKTIDPDFERRKTIHRCWKILL